MIFTHHPRRVWTEEERAANKQDEEYEAAFVWEFDPTRTYDQATPSAVGKPWGLWLSVDDDWRRWCDDDSGWTVADPHYFEVDTEACLALSSAEDIDALTREYGIPESGFRSDWIHKIDWARVAERYAGIVIAPYIWSRRLDGGASWYYGWDCASACIWDLSALTYLGTNENINEKEKTA